MKWLAIKKTLILKLMMNQLNISDFMCQFGDCSGNVDLCKELTIAREAEGAELVDLLLYLSAVVNFCYYDGDILNQLVTASWHQKHEEVVRLLAHYKQPSSANHLYEAALFNLDYRDYDEDFVLANKCIMALEKIQNQNAIEKIELLANADNELIRQYVQKHLNRVRHQKEKGHWNGST
ncbi:hypothetical protein N7V53_15110 [Kosakonia sp. HypNH10]|uniref:hypothetical protein n=1 Tax=Kosakonia sp. HypNH10 TaxID=2980101 RepID=UPI00244D507A|nr:hypothetical protein [Kosakonia sp. HypNH10]MDH2913851.1 hypothetical protein [Kosakonia sp. HypNH10]